MPITVAVASVFVFAAVLLTWGCLPPPSQPFQSCVLARDFGWWVLAVFLLVLGVYGVGRSLEWLDAHATDGNPDLVANLEKLDDQQFKQEVREVKEDLRRVDRKIDLKLAPRNQEEGASGSAERGDSP